MNGIEFDLEMKLLIVCVFMLQFGSVMIDWKTLKIILRLRFVDY